MKFVLYAILIFLAYQLIFKLVIPVYRASKKIRQGFREMQEKMQQQQSGFDPAAPPQGFDQQSSATKTGSKANPGDYIEFEELK